MIRKFGVFLAALALIAGFGLTGCDSWMSGDHFFDTIADEVKYANAEVIPVYVRYPTSTWGSTSPNGRSSQKVDIPFTVTAVDNNEYGFYKWAAFSTTNYRTSYGRYNVQLVDSEEAFDTEYADDMLGEDEVVFEDPYSPSTTVRVLSERDDVFIMPVCVKRPVLQDSLPAQNQTGATKNTTIQLIFSNAMNPNFLLVKSDGTAIPDGYTGDKFLNTSYVHVEQIMASGEHPFYADITTRLRKSDNSSYTTTNGTDSAGNAIIRLPAELNTSGKTLTIKLPSSTAYWPNGTILVTIDQDVQDKLGYTMPDDNELVFGAGNDEDTIKPVIRGLEVGTTSLSNNAGDNYPRVGKNFNVRAYIVDQSDETASEGNVNLVKFDLRRYTYEVYRTLPSPVSGISPSNGYYSEVYLNPDSNNYSPAVNFTDMPGVYPKAVASSSFGTVFQIQPQIAPGPGYDSGCGGLYKLTAYGVDNVGNQGDPDDLKLSKDGNDAGYKYIMFIRDIDAPDAATCAGKISSANLAYAPYGWYGSNGLGHIQLKEVSAGAIKDAGVPDVHQDTDPDLRYYSDTVWWAFFAGSSTAADTWATSMQQPENAWDSSKWTEVSSTSTPLSTLLGHDLDTSTITEGDVTIYAVFKDDVGNVSSKAAVNAIKYDGTAPQVGTLSWITASDVPMGFTGHAKIDNHTLAIPFTESLSGIKKIAIEVVPPGGGAAYKQAFSAADFSIRRKDSAGTYTDCGFTRDPATPAAGAAQNLVLGGSTYALDYSLKSDTSYTYLNAIYLDNLKIAASDSDLVEGNYTIKVKLYDAALNESAEKTITICVDNAAPVIQKLLVKDAKQYAEEASESDDDDTYKYFLPSSAYDSSISGYKATLEVTVQEAAGLLELSLGSDAYLTSTSTVSLKNAATNAAITAPYSVSTTDNKILFTEKGTAMCATGNFIVTITNVKISGTSSGVGSRTISVTAKDYALLSPENAFSTLSFGFDNDSNTYGAVLVDNSNSSPANVTTFTVKGSPYDADPDGYANNPTLAKTTLVLPSFGESGLKKIKLTGAKANYGGLGGTRVYLGTETSGSSATTLGYITEDGGNTIVLTYPLTGTTPTLTITNLELTSLTQGSNTLSVKYEYLAGWESSAKTTTVIYDNVAPVVEPSTESMKWIVNSSSTGTAGITGTATVNNQYLVIPVTETNSGVRKIRIEVEKENAEGTMAATTTASCENVSYVGYSSSTGTSTSGASTLGTSYWSVSGNEITIVDPTNYGKYAYYYIRGITISSAADAALEEGNYTLKVTVTDYAGNPSTTKTIDISNDHTKPVVKDTWFEGVENTALNGSGTYKHPHHRTYTNSSTGNILYVKLVENGSGIKNINLDHYTGYDPYSGAGGCRTVIPTASTKLYKSTDNGTTYTEVTGISYSATSSDRSITISQTQAIYGSGEILLKITELKITEGDAAVDNQCRNEIAAALRVDLTDFATNVNEAPENPASATVGTNNPFAAVVEDSSSPGFKTDCGAMRDSGKRISDSGTLVDDENSIAAYDGYTNTSVVNIECAIGEFAWNSYVTSPSGLRVIKLEGASFIPDTEQDGSSGSYITWSEYVSTDGHANFNSISSGQQSQYYLSSEDSIKDCGFGYANTDLGFYLVGDDTLVFRTPMNVRDANWFYINNIKLNSTTSDGSKSVTVKLFDTANQYSTSCASVGTATFSIVYCGTAPEIKVNDDSGSDPSTITAANIQTLVPKNNGLQTYADATTNKAWVYSYDGQGNRKGTNTSPSGSGVYISKTYCPYFDLKITSSDAAKPRQYNWTYDTAAVPSSGWSSTNSSYQVNVTFPTYSSTVADPPARDIYLHVADYAGNVTTKKMSTCKWINEVVPNAWPHRNSDGDDGKIMVDGAYYLEASGTYSNSSDPKFTVTFPAGTSGKQKIYIPPTWFNPVFTNETANTSGAPIYGYAIGNHSRLGEGHEDISKATFDANGPYLEIPQSYITEANAQSTNYAEFYFYVYDAVGQDLTAVVRVTVDSTPPWFEASLTPKGGSSDANKHLMWSEKPNVLTLDHAADVVDVTNRLVVGRSYGDEYAPFKTFMTQGGYSVSSYETNAISQTGQSAEHPFVLYTDADEINTTLLIRIAEGDTLKFTRTIEIDGTPAVFTDTSTPWPDGSSTFYYKDITIPVTNPSQLVKLSAVDKGCNTSDIYLQVVKDTAGPTISATDVQKVNQITETVGGTSEVVNYFGSQATAKISISDEYAGLSSANGGFSTDSVNLVNDLPEPTSDKSLVISVSDRFGNASNSSMTYNGSNKWVMDVTSPGTPTLSYDASYPYPTTNSISSDYNKYNSNGLTVTSSGSSYTIKYAGGVNTITISPNPNSSDSDVMGYLFRDSTTGLATFYSVADVSQSITIPVTPTSSTITKYIYAVDKAGNPSSDTSYLTVSLQKNDTSPTLKSISGTGLYSSGANGWFKSGANLTPVVATVANPNTTITPSQGIIGYGHEDGQWTIKNPYSSPITVPADYDGKPSIWLCFYSGEWCEDYFIKAEGGTVSATTSNTVTTWTLDATPPSEPTVSCSAENVYCNSSTKTIYYKSGVNSITITPSSTDTGGSGVKGYALSPTGTPATSITVPESGSAIPSSITVYAFDNVGNSNSETFTLTMDSAKPTIERAAGENSLDGCIPVGGNLFFKDGNAKLKIKVTDTGSGLKSGSSYLTLDENSEVWIKLSDYVSTSGVVTIPNPSNSSTKGVSDNVGNAYTSDSPYQLTGLVVKEDSTPPTRPTSVSEAAPTGGVCLDTSSGIVVYYNDTTTAVTLTLVGADDGTNGSGVTGYTVDGISDVESTAITVTIPVSGFAATQSVSIKSKDGVGNESEEALSVTFIKDEGKPSVSITSITGGKTYSGTSAFYYNNSGSYAKAKLSISDSGSGLASGSWQDNKEIQVSTYYNSTSNIVEIETDLIVDNVGNTQSYQLKYNDKNIIFDATGPDAPTVSAISATGGAYHQDGNTVYFSVSGSATQLVITPYSADNLGGCGVAGYSTSSSGTTSSTIAINVSSITSSTTQTIYAIDNLGNASTALTLTLVKDETKPSVSISSVSGGKTYTSGSTMYFKDASDTDKVQAVLSITDSGSGLKGTSWQNGKTLNLSDSGVLNGNGEIVITSGNVIDNVENTQEYVINGYTYKFVKDVIAPDAPTGFKVTAPTSGVCVKGTATDGYYPATGTTVYYSGTPESLTLALTGSSDAGCGLAGYALNDTDTPDTTVSVDLTSSPTSVAVYAYDKLGNKSTAFTITLIKDVAAPTFTQNDNTINPATTKAFSLSSGGSTGWKVNVFSSGTTISIPITETGSGLKRYALIQSSSYEANPATASWANATGSPIEFELPEVTSPKTNLILLLEDNVGNVTVDDATNHYKNSTIEKDGGWWMQLGSLSDITATYSVIESGAKMEITLSNVAVPIKSIEATAAGATGGEGKAKFDYKKDDGTIDYAEVLTATGITNGAKYTDSTGYLPHAGTVKFVLAGSGLTAPTSIKINGTELAAASISPATSLSGFIRHNLPAIESLVDNSGRSGEVRRSFVRERTTDLAEYFNALSSAPEEKAEDTKIAFNIGRNMENGGIAEKTEKVVTTAEEGGYMDEASIAEELPVQNHAWRAPDGFVSEETEAAGNQLLAQNAVVEFSSPNKVLTATDAALEDESGKNYEKWLALALSLLSVCALGLVVTLGRGRMKKNS